MTSAKDGVEALEAFASGHFDAVLLDLQMPRMDGLAAARAIRARPGDGQAPRLIALTASTSETDALACRDAGMDAVIVKPYRIGEVAGMLFGADP